MNICVGDLVKRKRPGRLSADYFGLEMTASNLFYDGFYLVLEKMEASVEKEGAHMIIGACKVMDCFGRINWISEKCLMKIQ